MGEMIYEPLIRDMIWSYSRVKSFGDCPYRWFLRYIKKHKGKELFFASYGTFAHKLLEQYYKGELSQDKLYSTYLGNFKEEVKGSAPDKKIFTNYFKDGLKYFKEFQPFPFETIAVEEKVDLNIDGVKFTGFIDYVGKDKDGIIVVDNKSRNLKPRSNRSKPTKTDEELDSYLRQLYLYSAAIKSKFDCYPKELCFNCFRTQQLIREPFKIEEFHKAEEWLKSSVNAIAKETDFNPNMDYFKCKHLCEMQQYCDYYRLSQKRR